MLEILRPDGSLNGQAPMSSAETRRLYAAMVSAHRLIDEALGRTFMTELIEAIETGSFA